MPAYVVVDIEVTNPSLYERYKELAGATVAKHGGKYLARGGATTVLEGSWQEQIRRLMQRSRRALSAGTWSRPLR